MADWDLPEERELIDERKTKNIEYHHLKNGRQKSSFWVNIAQKINNSHHTSYTGKQCHEKFNNLTRAYNVSILSEL
jgi:hypothetical protein